MLESLRKYMERRDSFYKHEHWFKSLKPGDLVLYDQSPNVTFKAEVLRVPIPGTSPIRIKLLERVNLNANTTLIPSSTNDQTGATINQLRKYSA